MNKYRCQGCRHYFARPEYRRTGLGAVCSLACLQAIMRSPPRSRAAALDVPDYTRDEVKARDGNRCRYCGTTANLHLHHITLRSHGVDHSPQNLIVLCGVHHDLVHENTRYWQPILRAYIWDLYVAGIQRYLRDEIRVLKRAGLLPH